MRIFYLPKKQDTGIMWDTWVYWHKGSYYLLPPSPFAPRRGLYAAGRASDARIGMRWPEEVEQNVKLVHSFKPIFDVSRLPRSTAGTYKAQDAEMDS